MYKIDEFNESDLQYVLECNGFDPHIVFSKILVIFKGGNIVFAKKINDLDIIDLVNLGINVTDIRYVHYLVNIARQNSNGKRKSLTL